jgi:LysR family transcriptional regulator, nod-box dependent transcriptional activator
MSRMAQLCAAHLPLRLFPPPFAIPTVTHCLQWHRYQDQDPGSIWLRFLLRQAAGNLTPVRHPKRRLEHRRSALE